MSHGASDRGAGWTADECAGGDSDPGSLARADRVRQDRGEDTEDDVEDRKETGDEGGGVAERDDDHMGGKPEVRIEHGAHHFHRVAGEGKVMGDDERDEADGAGDHEADGIAPEEFEDDAEEAGADADEDGGGVEI